MKDNKVGNKPCPVEITCCLNDRDYLNDVLESTKDLNTKMATMLNEASNESLYKKFEGMANDIRKSQRNLFELAFSKGWYILEEMEEQKIKEKHQELQKLGDEMSHKA